MSSDISNNFNNQIKKTKNLYLNSTRFRFQDSSDNASLNNVHIGDTLYVSNISSNISNSRGIPQNEIQIADQQTLHILNNLTVNNVSTFVKQGTGNNDSPKPTLTINTADDIITATNLMAEKITADEAQIGKLFVTDLIPDKLRIKHIYSLNSETPIASTYGAYSSNTDYTDQLKLLTYGLYECSGDLWVYSGEKSENGIHFGTNGTSVQLSSNQSLLSIWKDNTHTARLSTTGIKIQNNAGENDITLNLNVGYPMDNGNADNVIDYQDKLQDKSLTIGKGYMNSYHIDSKAHTYFNISEELCNGQLTINADNNTINSGSRMIQISPNGLKLRNPVDETMIDWAAENGFNLNFTTFGKGSMYITNEWIHYEINPSKEKHSIINIYPSYLDFTILLNNSENLGQYQFNETGLESFTDDNKSIVGFNQIATNNSDLTLKAVSNNINLDAEVININGKLSINNGLNDITIGNLNNGSLSSDTIDVNTLKASNGTINQLQVTSINGDTAYIGSVSSTSADTETIYVDKITSNTKFTESDNGIPENEIQVAEGQTFHILKDLVVDGKAKIKEVDIEDLTVDKVEANEISLRTITPTTMAVGATESDEEIEAVSDETTTELKIKNVENKMHVISTDGIELDNDTNVSGTLSTNNITIRNIRNADGTVIASTYGEYKGNSSASTWDKLLTRNLYECGGSLHVYRPYYQGQSKQSKEGIDFDGTAYAHLYSTYGSSRNVGLELYSSTESNSQYCSINLDSYGLTSTVQYSGNQYSYTNLYFGGGMGRNVLDVSQPIGTSGPNNQLRIGGYGYYNEYYKSDSTALWHYYTQWDNGELYMNTSKYAGSDTATHAMAGYATLRPDYLHLNTDTPESSNVRGDFYVEFTNSNAILKLEKMNKVSYSKIFEICLSNGMGNADGGHIQYLNYFYDKNDNLNTFEFYQKSNAGDYGYFLNYLSYGFGNYDTNDGTTKSSYTYIYKDNILYQNGITFKTGKQKGVISSDTEDYSLWDSNFNDSDTSYQSYLILNNDKEGITSNEDRLKKNGTIIKFIGSNSANAAGWESTQDSVGYPDEELVTGGDTIAYIFNPDGLEAYTSKDTSIDENKLTLKGFDIIDAKEFLVNGQPLTVGSSNEINIDHLQVDEIYTTTKTKVSDDEEVEYGNNLSISFTDNDNNTVNTKFSGSIESNGFTLKDSSGKPLASNYGTYQSGNYENKSQLLTYGLWECSGNLYIYSGSIAKDTNGNSIINYGTNNANYITLNSNSYSYGLTMNYDSGNNSVYLNPQRFNMYFGGGSKFDLCFTNSNLITVENKTNDSYSYWGNGFVNMYHPTSGSEGGYVYEQLQNGQLTIARNNSSYYGAGSRYIQIKPNLIQMRCDSSEKATIDVVSNEYLIDFVSNKGGLIINDNYIYYRTDFNQTNEFIFYQTNENSKYIFTGTANDTFYDDSIYLQHDGIIATGNTEKSITGFNTITTTNVNTTAIETTTINAPVTESTDTSTTTETLTLNATTVNIVGNLTINGEPISNSTSNNTSNNSSLNYVICETDGAINIKEITIENFTPVKGSTITIEFTNAGITEDNIKFNINNTEYSVYANGTELKNNLLKADNVYMFIYNGTVFKSLNTITDETEIEDILSNIVEGSVSNEEVVSQMENLISIDE